MTVTVIFLNGSEREFANADYRVKDGVLTVWENSYAGRRDAHNFPLTSIRTWRVQR